MENLFENNGMQQKQSSKRVKPKPLLAFNSQRDQLLLVVLSILICLSCLSSFAVVGAWQISKEWTHQFADELTVQILPNQNRDADEDTKLATSQIKLLPGVTSANALEHSKTVALLEPWLGKGSLLDELPIPRLISVKLNPDKPPAPGAIEELLKSNQLIFNVDHHDTWEVAIQSTSMIVRMVGAVSAFFLTLAAAAVTILSARASLISNWQVSEALHIVGAPNFYIIHLFQKWFFWVGLKSGFIGTGLASLTWFLLHVFKPKQTANFLVKNIDIEWTILVISALFTLGTAALFAITAHLTVRSYLRTSWSS